MANTIILRIHPWLEVTDITFVWNQFSNSQVEQTDCKAEGPKWKLYAIE